MFLRGLAVFALLSSVLGHHLGTSYKHRHNDRSVNPGCTCNDALTRQANALCVTSAPTPTPTTTVNDSTEFTSSASTTAPDSTMSPTRSTGTSESSTSAPYSQCSSIPINGCANSRNIIAQSSVAKGEKCFDHCSKNIDCTGFV
ncbi:hypothetical protein V497_02023, partial [Pseudogymnoascus sp. VKM F-4516 (FW-969)]